MVCTIAHAEVDGERLTDDSHLARLELAETGADTLRFSVLGLPSVDDAELLQLLVQQ